MPGFETEIDLDTLDGVAGFRTNMPPGSPLTFSAASIGDMNGDGFDDFAIGHPGGRFDVDNGVVLVVFGGPGGLPQVDPANLDGANGFRLVGSVYTGNAGFSVSAAGDINGDGFADLVVGGIHNDGQTFVIFGRDTDITPFDALMPLLEVDGTDGFLIQGVSNQGTGFDLSSVGDFNGDGLDDFVVLSYGGTTGAHIVFGQTAAFPAVFGLADLTPQTAQAVAHSSLTIGAVSGIGDFNGDGLDDVAFGISTFYANSGAVHILFGDDAANHPAVDLAGPVGLTLVGEPLGYRAGWSISGAGDVNGDGLDDIVVGTNHNSGLAYVVYGGFSGSTLDLATLDGTQGFKLTSFRPTVGFTVASAGDLNGDGYGDLAIGNEPFITAGSFVVFGRPDFGAEFSLGSIASGGGGIYFGFTLSVSGFDHGDFNGDGVDDLLVGGSPFSFAGSAAYVLYGRVTRTASAAGETLNGGGLADELNGAGGKDVLNGGGGDDIMDGGAGNDSLLGGEGIDQMAGGLGNDLLDGGSGNDTISDDSGANKLSGGGGDDILTGGTGADQLLGGADNDTISGGAGNDFLDGGTGVNGLSGGLGNDVYIVTSAGDTVIEAAGEGTDIVRSTITYSLTDNVEVLELDGLDLDGTGNALGNTLRGSDGANTLTGLAGNDKLEGGLGNDILIGGLGRDQLTGGTGADTFRILVESVALPALEIDTVTDYEIGVDILDFSAIDANGGLAGDAAFTVSTTGLHRIAGELYVFFNGTVSTVRLDVNGDGLADYQMSVNGNVTGDTATWLL